MNENVDLDFLFENTGGFGLYQVLLVISKQWMAIHLCCISSVFYSLGSIPPVLTCYDPNWNERVTSILDSDSVDSEDIMCAIRANCFNYSAALQFRSFVYEFDLLCDREPLYRNMVTASVGVRIVSNLFLGHIADNFGRKWIFIFSYCISLISLYLASVAVNYEMLFGTVIGMLIVKGSIADSLFSELVTKNYRSVMTVASQWCIAFGTNALIGYITGDWRLYLQTVAIISTPFVLTSCFLLGESPRWLIQQKKYERAEKSLKLIAKINGVPDPDALNVDHIGCSKEQKYPYNILHIFSSKTMVIRTILQSLHYSLHSMAAGVIMYDIYTLAGSTYLNIAMHGFLRIWVPFVIVFVDWKVPKFGRKWWLLSSLAIVLTSYIVNFVIFATEQEQKLKILYTVLSQIAALVVVSTYIIPIELYGIELFPTVLRNITSSFVDFVVAIVDMLVPQILLFRHYWRPLPFLVVIIFGFVTFVLDIFFLPETHGEPLPESLDSLKDPTNSSDVKHQSETAKLHTPGSSKETSVKYGSNKM